MPAQRAELVPVSGLHARLRQLGAEYYQARSTQKAHVYYARPLRKWLKVQRDGVNCRVEYWADCPCSEM
jgi:hypothetical protein